MLNRTSMMVWASCLLGASAIAGCDPEGTAGDTPGGEDITRVQRALGTVVPFGLLFENGMRVDFAEIQNPTNVNTASIRGLAACDTKSLYVLVPDAQSPFSLFHSSDGGLSFTRVVAMYTPNGTTVPTAAKSPEIACDDGRLFTLDANKQLWFASIVNGNLALGSPSSTDPWTQSTAARVVDHIQGGDGTLYGVQDGPGLHPLYKAPTHVGGADIAWSLVSNIGSKYVTGGGSNNVSDRLAWPRRAFTTEPDGTSAFNDTILDGQNLWSFFYTGDERFSVLSAGATNLLFGLDNKTGSIRLVVITLKEDACTDGVDDDADGRIDSEDPACVEGAAVAFCALSGTVNGTYCVDRYQPATFLDQPNQNAGLVTCSNHQVVPPGGAGTPRVPKVGACVHVGTHSDALLTDAQLTGPDPAGSGRYCNMIWPSTHRWDLAWGAFGSDPCATIRNRNPPGGVVVRAGLYNTAAANNAEASCTDGSFAMAGATGTAPLQGVSNAVAHTTNACIVTASPTTLAAWTQPFPLSQQGPGTSAPFVHTFRPVDLAQFGHGETGLSSDIDRDGFNRTDGHEHAYDIALPEGVPLYAMHGGTVVMSRDRDVTFRNDCGSPFQGELWVRTFVGQSSTYQENFLAYYAHGRRRLVETGQTVRAGQLLGFSGRTGCAGGPHLHLGVYRNSNINAHTATSPQFGYHVNFVISTTGDGSNNMGELNLIDPFAWGNQVAFDPAAYLDRNTDGGFGFLGLGGWSVDLFIPGQRPHL